MAVRRRFYGEESFSSTPTVFDAHHTPPNDGNCRGGAAPFVFRVTALQSCSIHVVQFAGCRSLLPLVAAAAFVGEMPNATAERPPPGGSHCESAGREEDFGFAERACLTEGVL